jgi:hypothetical protein
MPSYFLEYLNDEISKLTDDELQLLCRESVCDSLVVSPRMRKLVEAGYPMMSDSSRQQIQTVVLYEISKRWMKEHNYELESTPEETEEQAKLKELEKLEQPEEKVEDIDFDAELEKHKDHETGSNREDI